MSENEKKKILDAEVDEEQLEKTTGGEGGITLPTIFRVFKCGLGNVNGKNMNDPMCNCKQVWERRKKDCANTVMEDGPSCSRADKCINNAISYVNCWAQTVD